MALFVLSVVLIGSGFVWAVATVLAVPDQHPSLSMVAYAERHGVVANVLILLGSAAFIAFYSWVAAPSIWRRVAPWQSVGR